MKLKLVNYTLLILWLLVIFYLSSEGHDASSGRSNEIVDSIRTVFAGIPTDVLSFLVRKAAHTVAYFILGILAYRVVRSYKVSTGRAVILTIGFVFLYALSDEFHQSFVPGRSPMVTDVLIDTIAATLSTVGYYFISQRKHGNKVKIKV